MNTMSKIAIMTASVVSIGALTACQTTTAPKDAQAHQKFDGRHADRMDRKMSPEQREMFKARQAERKQVFEQIQKACDGKAVGQTVQLKVGEKAIDGRCNIYFKADHKDMKQMRGEHRPMRGDVKAMDMHRGDMNRAQMQGSQHQREALTDAKRAELTKQFDQRLAERQAREQTIAKACQGQSHGKAVQIKLGEQTVNGQCQVRFQPNAPVAPATSKAS